MPPSRVTVPAARQIKLNPVALSADGEYLALTRPDCVVATSPGG